MGGEFSPKVAFLVCVFSRVHSLGLVSTEAEFSCFEIGLEILDSLLISSEFLNGVCW